MASQQPETCYLLALPGELRNHIYRLALRENKPIAVGAKGYHRSGLLGTCREIRAETLQIYYYENHFDIAALELDSSTLARWCATLEAIDIRPRKVAMNPYIRQTVHWANLLKWIHQWHAGVIPARLTYPAHLLNAEVRVVHAMFDMAMVMRAQPWPFVRAVLEAQRPVLIAMNPGWAANM